MLEKTLTNKIIKHINQTYKSTTWLYKRFAQGNDAGQPDITGIHQGMRVEIEVKAPHRDLGSLAANHSLASKRQQFYLTKYARLGGLTGVVCSLPQALEVLRLSNQLSDQES